MIALSLEGREVMFHKYQFAKTQVLNSLLRLEPQQNRMQAKGGEKRRKKKKIFKRSEIQTSYFNPIIQHSSATENVFRLHSKTAA